MCRRSICGRARPLIVRLYWLLLDVLGPQIVAAISMGMRPWVVGLYWLLLDVLGLQIVSSRSICTRARPGGVRLYGLLLTAS